VPPSADSSRAGPSTALPGLLAHTGLSATSGGPTWPSRVVGWGSRAPTAEASRVASDLRVQACHHQYPGGTRGACRVVRGNPLCFPGRRPSPYSNRVGSHIGWFRALPSVHFRCGLPARRAARGDPWSRRLRRFRYLHRRSDSYRMERPVIRAGIAPLEIRALARRTAIGTPTARGPPAIRVPTPIPPTAAVSAPTPRAGAVAGRARCGSRLGIENDLSRCNSRRRSFEYPFRAKEPKVWVIEESSGPDLRPGPAPAAGAGTGDDAVGPGWSDCGFE
jgi:hypothetical protein